jgi:hypothetical protein
LQRYTKVLAKAADLRLLGKAVTAAGLCTLTPPDP